MSWNCDFYGLEYNTPCHPCNTESKARVSTLARTLPLSIAAKFRAIARFPCVAGCVDRTPVVVNPPSDDEDTHVNRHHTKSLNAAMVSGPDYKIYFCSSRCPGRWHDSRVLKESSLWEAFGVNGRRPFAGAAILGDSAYTCNDWLIPPFRGHVQVLASGSMRRTRKTEAP